MHQKIKFILTKIHETVLTRAAPFSPDTESSVGWGFAPYQTGEAYSAPPRPPSWISGNLLIREGIGGKGDGGKGGRGGKEREEGRREGRKVLRIPLAKILDSPLVKMGGRPVYFGTADAAAYSGALFCLRFVFVFFFPTTLIGATTKPISSN